MSKFKYLKEEVIDKNVAAKEFSTSEMIGLEIVHQLKRIADLKEKQYLNR